MLLGSPLVSNNCPKAITKRTSLIAVQCILTASFIPKHFTLRQASWEAGKDCHTDYRWENGGVGAFDGTFCNVTAGGWRLRPPSPCTLPSSISWAST